MIGECEGELQPAPKGGIGKHRVYLLLISYVSMSPSSLPSSAWKSLCRLCRFHCSSEVRLALLKERRERFLGFVRSYARREFLVLELYRSLELIARCRAHHSFSGLQRSRRFLRQFARGVSCCGEQVLIWHNSCHQTKLGGAFSIEA